MRGGHRSAIVWSVPKDDAAGWLVAQRRGFRGRGPSGDGRVPRQDRAARAALVLSRSASIMPRRSPRSGSRWSAMPRMRSIRSPGRGSTSASATSLRSPQVLVEGARLGLDLGDRQLLDRYQRWRSLDALSVAFATDSLTRIYGVPGRTASAVRRFGMGLVGRIAPLRNRADERGARHQRRTSAAAPWACRSELLDRRLDLDPAGHRRAVELHQLDQQVRAAGQRHLLRAAPAWRRCRTARPGRWH